VALLLLRRDRHDFLEIEHGLREDIPCFMVFSERKCGEPPDDRKNLVTGNKSHLHVVL
jgi:hypothetical protein